MSARAAILLNKLGYRNAMAVIGGLDEMPKAGFMLKIGDRIVPRKNIENIILNSELN